VGAAEIRAVNFDPHCRPKRQDWNGELVENGAFYLSSVQLLRQGLIQGGKYALSISPPPCSFENERFESTDLDQNDLQSI
jgi:N-acylneuraminate cytidylyltransferase